MSMASARLERLLVLVPYIVKNPGISVDKLTADLGIARSELISDLELLMMCGLPEYTPDVMIDFELEKVGGEEVVRLRAADYLDRPVSLTRPEAFALLLGLRLLGSASEVAESGSLAGAEAKIAQALGRLGDEAEDLAERVEVSLDPAAHLEVRRAVARAIKARRRLEIDYYTAGRGRVSKRRIDPHTMVCTLGIWYVVAYCHRAEDMRVFRLDRMASVRSTGESFKPRPDFDPDAFSRGVMPDRTSAAQTSDGSSQTAVIRVDLQLEPRIREAYPAECIGSAPGGCTLKLSYEPARARWLVNQLLAWAPHAEAIAPAELRRQIADSAETLALSYS